MHLRPLMILRRDKNPACTQMMLLQNVQSWQLICPQTVRKKARSLKVNDIQTQSLTSNPILSATFTQIRLKNRAQRGFFVRRLCKSNHILSNGCPMKPTLFFVSRRACGD